VRPFLEPGADAALLTPENLLRLTIDDLRFSLEEEA